MKVFRTKNFFGHKMAKLEEFSYEKLKLISQFHAILCNC